MPTTSQIKALKRCVVRYQAGFSSQSRALAEGIECEGEFEFLRSLGVELFQGYWFAKPGFETLPEVDWHGI